MTTRQPGDVVAVCPVCGDFVDVLNPEQVPRAPEASQEEFIEAVVAANSAIMRAHLEATHTVHEVMVCLGEARNALMAIRDQAATGAWLYPPGVVQICDHGLGGK
jgi:hypothetical protein